MEKEDTINTRKYDENRDFDSESTSIFTDLKKEKLKTKEVILSKATEVIESHVTKKRKKRKNETVKKECNNEVFAVKTKRASFSQSQRRFVRTEKQVHSGDNTVPYVSLSAAHRWLEDDSGGKEEDNKKWTEKRPEIIHKNLFDTWATLKMTSTVTTVDPAVDMFHSIRGNGDTTVIMEMYGVDHLDVAKHPYVHFLMFENLLIKMSQELCLNGTDTSCTKQFEADKSKKSIFRFPKDAATDVQRLGRQMSVAANQAIESLKERYQQ